MIQLMTKFFIDFGLSKTWSSILTFSIIALGLIIIGLILDKIMKTIVYNLLSRIVKKTKNKWDDIFIRKKIFSSIGHLITIIVLYNLLPVFIGMPDTIAFLLKKGLLIYIVFAFTFMLNDILSGIEAVYNTFKIARKRPIKSYLQVFKIIFILIALLLSGSILLDQEVGKLITGIGAATAIIMLLFRDSILGFVSGIQLSANNMVSIGDWIEMPHQNADGEVIEISLNTVKVQNWDKTITTIPTYALISESFKNWRGMQESGGRRIMRSIYIDVQSIKFCNKNMIDRFKKIPLIDTYIDEVDDEIYSKINQKSYNPLKQGYVTNIGVFRKYISLYISENKFIKDDMIHFVRQLAPTEKGVPLEIYCFADTTTWIRYEEIQADIFDHIFAISKYFGLDIYQNPSGRDFRNFKISK